MGFADTLILGRKNPWKIAVRVAALTNFTRQGLQTIDGVAVAVGDRVLLTAQTVPAENGIYVVSAQRWSRAPDAGQDGVVLGASVRALEGASPSTWRLSSPTSGTIKPDVTAQTWTVDTAAVPADVTRTTTNETAAAVNLTDATQTITVAGGKRRVLPTSMAADRVYTISANGVSAAETMSIHRPTATRRAATFVNGGPAGGRWKASTAGLYVYRFDGTNWAQVAAHATNGEIHINVRDFGAIGDGSTDDTAAILAALAAVPDGGGEVFFPPGDYLISDNLLVQRSGTKVYGAGNRLSRLYGPSTWTPTDSARMTQPAHIFLIAAASNGHDSTLIENVEVADLGFYGDMALSPPGFGAIGVAAAAAKGVVVRDCRFEHFAMPCVYQNNAAGSRWAVIGNEFYQCGWDGTSLGSPATINIVIDDVLVAGNILDSCYNPIGITHCSNVTVSGNVVRNPVVYGISVGDDAAHPTEHVTVSGNTIEADVPASPTKIYGIMVIAGSRNVSILGNTVAIRTVSGSASDARGIHVTAANNICVLGNSIRLDSNSLTIPLHGITVEPSGDSDVTLNDNTIQMVNEGGSSYTHQGIAAYSMGHVLSTTAIGNRAIGFSSTLSGYAFILSDTAGGGGTHHIVAHGNSCDSTGILRLAGYSDLNPGLTRQSFSIATAGATHFGARSRYPSPQQAITAAGNTITASGAELVRIANSTGGSITLTSAPTIASGSDGQTITLINLGTQNVVLQDQGTLASSNLRLTATTITLGPRQSVELTYLSSLGDWVQTGPVVAVL